MGESCVEPHNPIFILYLEFMILYVIPAKAGIQKANHNKSVVPRFPIKSEMTRFEGVSGLQSGNVSNHKMTAIHGS